MIKEHFDKVLNDYIKFKEDNNNKYANFQSITQSIPAALTIFLRIKSYLIQLRVAMVWGYLVTFLG